MIQTALHVNLFLSIYRRLIFTLTLNEGILGRPARIPRNEPEEPNILEPSNSELNDVRVAGADDEEPAAIAAAAAELSRLLTTGCHNLLILLRHMSD